MENENGNENESASLDEIIRDANMGHYGTLKIRSFASRENVDFRFALTDFNKKNIAYLSKIRDFVLSNIGSIVDEFAEHLLKLEATRRILTAVPGRIARIKKSHTVYFTRLFGLVYDEDYFVNRINVGFSHVKNDITPSIFIGGYSYLYKLISTRLASYAVAEGFSHEEMAGILNTLHAMFNMDEALVVDLYYQKSIDDIFKMDLDSIHTLSALAEKRDEDTGIHTVRMANYCRIIAEELGLEELFTDILFNATPMHDIGKVGIPDNILLKPGKLTKEEFEIMKTHTVIGYDILKDSTSPSLKRGAEIALSHHERYDGQGYPRGLKGEKIPLTGRITMIADVFDALTNKRVYKDAFSVDESLRIMNSEMGAGRAFDPECFDAFLRARGKIEDYRNSLFS